jgi:S1-C subfamily serine protease
MMNITAQKSRSFLAFSLALLMASSVTGLLSMQQVVADELEDEKGGLNYGRLFGFAGDSNRRDSRPVRGAFKEVVAEATEATVEVMCDNRRAALGAIVDPSGLILTKASELTGKVRCRLKGGKIYDAQLVASIAAFDLAVLKVDAAELPVVRWQTSVSEPIVGSWLATPGTSDIPRAIGVVSVEARRIPEQRGMLGVRLDDPPDGATGALILEVVDRSAADLAGLQEGDRVTHLGGEEITGGYRAFMSQMANKKAAEVVKLKVSRSEESIEFRVVLMPFPALRRNMETEIAVDGQLSAHRWGFQRIIQHDTLLTPKDCGGPLVNLNGETIGINIARAARVASYAVPASEVLKFLEEFRAGKHLVPPKAEEKKEEVKAEEVKAEEVKAEEVKAGEKKEEAKPEEAKP